MNFECLLLSAKAGNENMFFVVRNGHYQEFSHIVYAAEL